MRIGAAHRELSRSRGEIFLAPGYSLVPRTLWLRRFSSSPLPAGAHLWYKARDGLWWLGKVAPRASTDTSSTDSYIVRFLDDPGPIKIALLPSLYTTSRSATQGSWCLQRHQAGGLARGVLRNANAPPHHHSSARPVNSSGWSGDALDCRLLVSGRNFLCVRCLFHLHSAFPSRGFRYFGLLVFRYFGIAIFLLVSLFLLLFHFLLVCSFSS